MLSAAVYILHINKVLILSDPVWTELYLKPQMKREGGFRRLIKKGYVPVIETLPFDFNTKDVVEILENSTAESVLLSPAVSMLFGEGQQLETFHRKTFFIFSRTDQEPEYTPENIFFLRIDPEELSRELLTLMGELYSASESSPTVYLLWNKASYVSQEAVEAAQTVLERNQLSPKIPIITSEEKMSEIPINRSTLCIFLPGSDSENQKLMEELHRKGGKAIVLADSLSLEAWPDTVIGVMEIDISGILVKSSESVGLSAESRSVSIPFSLRF